jgi:hypothetical protein
VNRDVSRDVNNDVNKDVNRSAFGAPVRFSVFAPIISDFTLFVIGPMTEPDLVPGYNAGYPGDTSQHLGRRWQKKTAVEQAPTAANIPVAG